MFEKSSSYRPARRSSEHGRHVRAARGSGCCAGFTVTECLVSIVLLGAVMLTLGPVYARFGDQQRASLQREFALQEIQNALEELTSLPYDEIDASAVAPNNLTSDARSLLRDASLEAIVVEEDSPRPGKRITLLLSWRDRSGDHVRPVALSTWVYARGEGMP